MIRFTKGHLSHEKITRPTRQLFHLVLSFSFLLRSVFLCRYTILLLLFIRVHVYLEQSYRGRARKSSSRFGLVGFKPKEKCPSAKTNGYWSG